MARRVFFSFHYERDVWRVNVVRNSWVTKGNYIKAGFIDAAEFEEIKRQGDEAIKRWINSQLDGTSVTVVLIGAETYSRRWVRYEIIKSFDIGNGLLGVYIHNIKDQNGKTDVKGQNPFEYVGVRIDEKGKAVYYEWKDNKWVEFSDFPNCSRSFLQKYLKQGEVYTLQSLIQSLNLDKYKLDKYKLDNLLKLLKLKSKNETNPSLNNLIKNIYKIIIYPKLYDWVDDNGYDNLGDWIEEAAKQVGR